MTFIKYRKSYIRKRKKKVDKDRATTVAASSYLAHVNNPNHSSKDINACLSYLEHLGPVCGVAVWYRETRVNKRRGKEREVQFHIGLGELCVLCILLHTLCSYI